MNYQNKTISILKIWCESSFPLKHSAWRQKHFLAQKRLCSNADVVAEMYFLQKFLSNGRNTDFCRAGGFPVIPDKSAMGRVLFTKAWIEMLNAGSTLRHTLALSSNNMEKTWDFATGKLMPSHSSDVNAYGCIFFPPCLLPVYLQPLWSSKHPFLAWGTSEKMVGYCFHLNCGSV